MRRNLLLLALALLPLLAVRPAEAATQDLTTYWPNRQAAASSYPWGRNFTVAADTVLWFELVDQWTFRQYNSGPFSADARCHFDTLSWWDDGFLRYVATTDVCLGTEIRYDPPILVAPRYWNGGAWQFASQSQANYTVNGVTRCTGVTAYTANMFSGSPPRIRTQQNTAWATGDVVGGCWAGTVTRWQEDYTLGWVGQKKGMARSVGGNLDVPGDSWNIRFYEWRPLQ